MQSTNQAAYMGHAPGAQGQPLPNQAAHLKNNSFKMSTGGADYVTNNMIAYKWVQPKLED